MYPYTLIQLGMHSDPSLGGVDRYFWGVDQGFDQENIKTRRYFFDKGNAQHSDVALGSADLPLHKRLVLLRRGVLEAPDYDPGRSVLASHFALYALPVVHSHPRLTHVVHFHGPWAQESALRKQNRAYVFAKKAVERLVYRNADAFITLSNAFRDLLISNYGIAPQKVHVIPGAVDLSQFCPADRVCARDLLKWPQKGCIIFCIRRLVERMGLQELITAFSTIASTYSQVSLYIGGKGPLEGALRAQIRALGLDARVRVLGFVRESLLPTCYQAANISIVPSQSLEGFGLAAVESLACGTPVLVTPVGGLKELIGPLAPSCVLAGTSAHQIAESLNSYLRGALPVPIAAECVGYVKEHYVWEKVAKKVLAIYDEAFRAKHALSRRVPEPRQIAA